MTDATIFPDLAQDLIRIHRVITRAITIGAAGGDEFHEAGFPDPATKKGYADYIQTLGLVLAAHHHGEDEIAFPKFITRLPSAPYDRLTADHREIEKLLGSLHRAVASVAGDGDADDLSLLVDTLRRISAIWTPHIKIEEEFFSHDAVGAVMSLEEQGLLSASFGKNSAERSGPPFLAVPFVLFNLEPVDRAAMSAALPKNVLEEFVPITWKDQWAPMKPFLLK